MPHTPGYQPVETTSDIQSKKKFQSLKSRNQFINKYIMDKENDEQIRSIVTYTIGEEDPIYDIKQIQRKLRCIYSKRNQPVAATVVKTEWLYTLLY